MAMAFEEDFTGIVADIEADELLRDMRKGLVDDCYEEFAEAMAEEYKAAEEGQTEVYVYHPDVEESQTDIMAIMFTRDGIYPFMEELDEKEQVILYFVSDFPESVFIEHVRAGDHNKFVLSEEGLLVLDEEDNGEQVTEIDPSPDEIEVIAAEREISETERLANLREKVERFKLTPRP